MLYGLMYFGSVRFFKHLILTVFFGWLAAATVLAVYFGVKCSILEKKTGEADTDKPLSAYMDEIAAAGYSYDDIGEYIGLESVGLEAVFDDAESINEETVPEESGNASESVPVIAPAITVPLETEPADDIDVTAFVTDEPALETDVGNDDTAGQSVGYKSLYPELYVAAPASKTVPDSKTVFLTFDDGPSAGTYDILYILKKHNIKATFFMSGGKTSDSIEQMKAVAAGGHSIGVHSFLHDADKIYSSVEDYLADFRETCKMIYEATGIMPDMYRMPDENAASAEIRRAIPEEMTRRGFTRFGFNAESGDRAADRSWQNILDTSTLAVKACSDSGSPAILHLHDSADDYLTVLTLEDIIIALKAEGYSFEALDSTVSIN